MKPILNKWQFELRITRDPTRFDYFTRLFTFNVVKIIKLPPEGTRLRKENYKGFIFQIRFFWPIEIL